MAQRALVFKAPYGTAFMMQLDGSIWLVYDNAKAGSTDSDILNWLRDTAVRHSDYVEQFIVAEHRRQQEQKPIIVEPAGNPGIAAKVIQELQKPISVQVPPQLPHNFGGTYRVGAECKVCGVKATGLEPQGCPGVMIQKPKEPPRPTVQDILAPKPSQPSIVPVSPPAPASPSPATGTTIPAVPADKAAPPPVAPFPPPILSTPVPFIPETPVITPSTVPAGQAAPPPAAPFPPPHSPVVQSAPMPEQPVNGAATQQGEG